MATFTVQVNHDLPVGTYLQNHAQVNNGAGYTFSMSAPEVRVGAPNLYLPIIRR